MPSFYFPWLAEGGGFKRPLAKRAGYGMPGNSPTAPSVWLGSYHTVIRYRKSAGTGPRCDNVDSGDACDLATSVFEWTTRVKINPENKVLD